MGWHIASMIGVVVCVALLGLAALPRCQTEDSTWCQWNATTMGNGHGRSYVTLADGMTFYYGTELEDRR